MRSVKWGKNAFACRSEYEEGICTNHQKCNNIYLDLYIVVQGCNLFIFLSIYFSILITLLLNNHVNMMQNSKNKSKHTIFTFEIQIVSSYLLVQQMIIIFRLRIHMFIYAYSLQSSTLWYYSVNRHVSCEVCPMNYSIRHK